MKIGKGWIVGAAACAVLLRVAEAAAGAPAAAPLAGLGSRSPRAADAAAETATPTGRLPLEAEVPAEGLRWAIRVGREPMLRAALGTMGGGPLLLEVRDPAGAVVHHATVTAVELMDLAVGGKAGLWTFSVRMAPGGGPSTPTGAGSAWPPPGPAPARPAPARPVPAGGRPRVRFDVQAIEDRGVYAAVAAGASDETAAAAGGITSGDVAALVSSLEAEMARSRGGRIDQEGWAILMLLRRYLNLPPPSPPGVPSPAR